MYLAKLSIRNFRRLESVEVEFQAGLNVLVGPNNIGKSAVVDALRALLAGSDEPYPRLTVDDLHCPKGGERSGAIQFEYVFRDLSADDEADFLHAIRVLPDGKVEAVLGVTYEGTDHGGRLRARRWCGEHQEVSMTTSMLENLRSVYLPPLRDAEQALRPSRNSQLARLLHLLTDDAGRKSVEDALVELDKEVKKLAPLTSVHEAVRDRHGAMVGTTLAQILDVQPSGNDFSKFAARLSLIVDDLELDRNGLGYNNLIFMAVVLSELAKNSDIAYRGLLVEEPEAHLHPHLQAVLLRYLSNIKSGAGERPVQVFVTSHSPNFASIAPLDAITCMVQADAKVEAFHPRTIVFEKGKKEKLARFLDVTRAEIFFARRVVFVEGAAELMLIHTFAAKAGLDLRDHAVSLISVEGLNFDSFLPLFGEKALKVPVAVVTDADPKAGKDADGEPIPAYPAATDKIVVSENTQSLLDRQDKLVHVFHGVKTFEYDLALNADNRKVMLEALADLHPTIAKKVMTAVEAAADDRAKAEALFRGMFERTHTNVQKGSFAQALAARIDDGKAKIVVPEYLLNALKHACQT
jgi:putative ATP-dependent endonuclease of OLD family